MKSHRFLLLLALCLLLFIPLAQAEEPAGIFVKKVDNLSEDFIFGMDISSVLAEEASGVVYRDFDGNEADLFRVLAENGINTIRVRVWNHPYDAEGHGYGGGNCDIDTAVRIGRRAAEYGMKLLVDFHYSDFWADPGKQMAPLEWAGMEIEEKTEAVYHYTRDCLLKLREAGVDVSIVQTGNETNNLLCGEKHWFDIQFLMQAGARATREVYPDALVALHFANPENADSYATYARKMDYYNVDYDIFATSYYPYWHGTLENLISVMNGIADTYGKKVMVVETSYAYTARDSDFSPNTIGEGGTYEKPYPFTVQGQANCIRDITDAVVNGMHGIGVCYWEGAWISVGGQSKEENSALWEKYGSGWASSYAAAYDPKDAGKYYGGSAVDNQTLFDPNGYPLDSLHVFQWMRDGHEVPLAPDALEDASLICDLNAPLILPETVNTVMNDGSLQQCPVTWKLTAEDEAQMHDSGAAQYTILGEAGGKTARCYVSMVEYNYLSDCSFEDGGIGWKITDLKHADELYIEDKKNDSLTGNKHMHFWSAAQDSVEFTLEQTVADLPAGKFIYTVSIMGGDGGKTDIYAYVKIGEETVATAPMQITSYGSWDTAVIPSFEHPEGSEVTVGVYVKCQGAGNGALARSTTPCSIRLNKSENSTKKQEKLLTNHIEKGKI